MTGSAKFMTPSGGGVILQPSGSISSDVTVTIPITAGSVDAFPSGTLMLFQQTAAPTGWTKQTTHNDKALRVVSGTASSGGSVAFTTAFASGLNAGATTLSTSQIPAHSHGLPWAQLPQITSGGVGFQYYAPYVQNGSAGTWDAGGGGSHTHTLPSFAVSYVDTIIASKN